MAAERPDQPSEPTVETRLEQLEAVIAALAIELRTQRLVVTDEVGNERIVGEVVGGHAELQLVMPGSQPLEGTAVTLFSMLGDEDAPPGVGLQLWADGNALLEINAWRDNQGNWSTDVQLGQ